MQCFDLPVYKNELKNKKDLEKFIKDILKPLEKAFIRSNTRVHIGNTSSGASDEVSQIEGFSRIIWGLTTLDKEGSDSLMWKLIREGLVNGTTIGHPDYYGDVNDYDQRMVEMASIGFAFVLRPECIYAPLTKQQQTQLITWLDQINDKEAHNCNWKFFRVMVNIGFKQLGLPYNRVKMEQYLEEIDAYYMDHGWYRDGDINSAHADYYVPFAMHYYGLFYSIYMKDVDPIRASIYQRRGTEFAKDFVYWFAKEGEALPYGRSLTYRFAQVAFWSMVVVSGIETSLTLGEIKGIIMRHLRWWNSKPIYDMNSNMTIGYVYDNLFMGEDYNAPGSVYWSLKTMVITSLPADHEFWSVSEMPLPKLKDIKVQEAPGLVFRRDEDSSHILAYNGGHLHTNGHIHVECKYEKFVYSSFFGFSVPRSHRRLAFGAYDSTLAVSIDGTYYRHKDKSSQIELGEQVIKCIWTPFEGIIIDTYIIMGHPWHIRLHRIQSEQKVYTAEGGFALGLESMEGRPYKVDSKLINDDLVISTEVGFSRIADLTGNQKAEVIKVASNTNIMNPRTLLPTLLGSCEPGQTILCSYICGDKGGYIDNMLPRLVGNNNKLSLMDEHNRLIFETIL